MLCCDAFFFSLPLLPPPRLRICSRTRVPEIRAGANALISLINCLSDSSISLFVSREIEIFRFLELYKRMQADERIICEKPSEYIHTPTCDVQKVFFFSDVIQVSMNLDEV